MRSKSAAAGSVVRGQQQNSRCALLSCLQSDHAELAAGSLCMVLGHIGRDAYAVWNLFLKVRNCHRLSSCKTRPLKV
jgi:hypothetical protein